MNRVPSNQNKIPQSRQIISLITKNMQLQKQNKQLKEQYEDLLQKYKKQQLKNKQLQLQQNQKYSNKKQNNIQYQKETLYYKYEQNIDQSKTIVNDYQDFAEFSIQKCEQYEKLIIKLKKVVNQQMYYFKNKMQSMAKDYQNIHNNNNNAKQLKMLCKKLKQQVKKYQQFDSLAKTKLGNDWNQWQQTIHCFEFDNSYNNQSDIQKQLQYLKQIIKGICFGLDRLQFNENFKGQVSYFVSILQKVAKY